MCDERTVENALARLRADGPLSRRDLGQVAVGAGAALALSACAQAIEANPNALVKQDILVPTPDGEADAYFVHPVQGAHAGVILWPDIMGPRPSFRMMAERLAGAGYAVLVPNPYYRQARAPFLAEGEWFSDPHVREKLLPLARSLTTDTVRTDTLAMIAFLDSQDAVDTGRQIGVMGYCMTGPWVIRGAAEAPERIGAGASFHGGGLATDRPDSPHLLAPKIDASFLIAVAEDDDQDKPEEKDKLRQAFDAAGIQAEIEVYEGTLHGWCPPDSPVYDEAQAERAWSRLLALFGDALA